MGQYKDDFLDSSINSRMSIREAMKGENLRHTLEKKGMKCRDLMDQYVRLQNAKQVAYEQASIVMKEKLDLTVKQLQKEADNMQKQLREKHNSEMEEIKTIRQRLGKSLSVLESALQNLDVIELDDLGNIPDSQKRCHKKTTANDKYVNLEECQEICKRSRKIPSADKIEETLESLSHELEGGILQYRSVQRFVPCTSLGELKLGVFQECFLDADYRKVTRYNYDSVTRRGSVQADNSRLEGRSRGHSFTGRLPRSNKSLREGTLRRAKSDAELKKSLTLTLFSIPLDDYVPYKNPVLKYKITTSYSGNTLIPSGVAFLPNNNLIISDKTSGSLDIYNHEDGNPCHTIRSPGLRPANLCITREGYIMVADEQDATLKAFTRGGDLVCKFGTGYFKAPVAVEVDSRDNYVVIDSQGEWQQYVFKYNAMTGELKKIGYDGHGMLTISKPEGIAVGYNDAVIATDSVNCCIHVFSCHGNLIRKYGREGDGDGELSYPKGVCTDNRGNVIVADCGNHRVSLFNKHGEFVRHMLTEQDGLSFPHGVALNESTSTILVSQDRRCLLYQY